MPDFENDLPPGEDTDLGDEDVADTEPEPEPEIDVAALQREIQELRARDGQRERDLKAQIGRFQSSLDRLESGRGDSASLAAQAESQYNAIVAQMDALLSDETIAPETRARVQQARAKAQADSDFAAMKAQLQRLVEQQEQPAVPASGIDENVKVDLTTEMTSWIIDEGLDPDDSVFDWRGKATELLYGEGPAAVRAYFRKQINAAKETAATVERRQKRKESAAGDSPAPAGNEQRRLDPSKSLEERLKILQADGII